MIFFEIFNSKIDYKGVGVIIESQWIPFNSNTWEFKRIYNSFPSVFLHPLGSYFSANQIQLKRSY